MIEIPVTARAGKVHTNLTMQEIYKNRKRNLMSPMGIPDPETMNSGTTHYLPDCHCGGHAKHWLQIITAANIWHWIECLSCGKYTELTRSRDSAEQNWRDIVAGVIREKRIHWDIGF